MVDAFKPVQISEYFLRQIAAGLKKEIYDSLFKPIFQVLNTNSIYNDKKALTNAIQSGRIYYENGAFRSNKPFSNAVADELEKLGAKYRNGAYYIERAMLPLEIENTLALVSAREAAKIAALNGLLARLAATVGQETAVKLFIEKATERMFKKLQVDLEESTQERKVPVIDISVDIPDLEVSETKLDKITRYWEETDAQAAPLHDDWAQKDKEVKQLEDQLKSAKGEEKREIEKQLTRTKTERENARQKLADFREKQRKNAPNIDLNTDVIGIKGDDKNEGLGDDGGNGEGSEGGAGSDSGDNPPVDPNSNGAENPPTDDSDNPPKLNLDEVVIDKRAKKIAEDYTYNMDYWVKKWKAKEIVKMRRTVLHMVQNGARIETIKDYFMKRWGIAERKAEFLARNESGIAGSVLKATHYQDMGCTHFMWLRSTSKEKRELHLEYAKKTGNQYGIGGTNIFAFNNPPIIEQIKIGKGKDARYVPKPDGKRGLPQQTYNCWCDFVGIRNPDLWVERRKRINNAKRNIFTKIKYAIENSMQRNNYPWRYRRFGQGA